MIRNTFKMSAYRHSFQIRLFASITGMTILFIAITGYFSYLLGRRSVEKQIEQYALGTAGQISERVRTYLSQPVKNVSVLKAAIEKGLLDPLDQDALIRFFHVMQNDYPEFLNINYGDKNGRFTMVPPQRPEVHKLFDPRVRPWYVGAMKTKRLFWTGVYVFASSQHPGITVSAPILEPDGRSFAGVCSIDIDLSSFSKFLNTLKIGKKGYAYIIDNAQDRVIAHPELLDLHFNPERVRFLNEGLARLKAANLRFDQAIFEGQKYFTAYIDYPENNWSVGVNLPVTDFLENINAIKKATLTLVLVAVCISCVVSYLVALTIVRPLRLLEQGIQRVSAGDLNHKVQLQAPHIVGTVADAFNQMAASLKQSREALKQTYVELAEKEKMAALGQLTAGIAHEIKNPLGIILGSAQVVTNPNKPEEMRLRAAQFIIDEVIRLNHTLKSFLAFARPAPPALAPVDIGQLLDETIESISETLAEKGIRVDKQVSDDLPICLADADQMRQVFLNILLNATQAMSGGGTLGVQTATVHSGVSARTSQSPDIVFEGSSQNTSITIAISDTGEGIPPGRLEQIFEPFATFKDDGTGLGLSIVNQILKLHHARIEVESSLSTGSTFRIHFPCLEEGIHAL